MKKNMLFRILCIQASLALTAALTAGCGSSATKHDFSADPADDPYDSSADASALSPYFISEAVYPQMALYPSETFSLSADDDGNRYDLGYDAWRESRNAQLHQPEGYQDSSVFFFQSSMPAFLRGTEAVNPVYSPLNIYMALAMLAETTDTDTRAQILAALGAPDMPTLRSQANAVWNASYCRDGAVTSVLASSLWLNEDLSFRRDTLDLLAGNYYASSFRGKMGSADFNSALQSWLNEQTGGLLRESASEIQMDPDTVMTLAATVYYQGKWSHTFSEGATDEAVFHSPYGDMTCHFMHQSGTRTYYWGDHFSAVSQSFEARGGSMWLILPDENNSASDLLTDEQVLSLVLSECASNRSLNAQSSYLSKYLVVNLSVPKFDVCCQLDLKDGLETLGITDVFRRDAADFSPLITGDTPVFLSQATHAARVVIDEEGCKAAAFTVMMATGASMPPDEQIDFILDRPFLFVLTGIDGLPLFAGIVNQP